MTRYEKYAARHGVGLLVVLMAAFALAGCKDQNAGSNVSAGTPAMTTGQPGTTATASGDAIVIGEYGSLTGTEADFGKQTHEGIQLAVDETNAAGGIEIGGKKRKLQLETEDDASDAGKAETAVKRLIDEKNVTALLGEVASGNSLAGGRIAQERGVPMISPSSTNPAVTANRDYVFRVCFTDPYQAAVVARFARDGLKANRVAVFTNKSAPYSVGFATEFKKAFTRYGGQIVADQSYSPTDQDFRGALTALKSSNPDAILVPGYYSDAGSIAKQARDLGIKVPLLGGDGWSSQDLFKIGGDAVNGCYLSDHVSVKDPSPVVQNFVQKYQAKYNKPPTSMSILGYDAASLLFDAIKRANSTDKQAIRDTIAQTKDFQGVSGKITINRDRNADKQAVILAVKNGQFEYQTSVPDPEKPLAANR
jgi:branched-chain amino acid transport system substrate-binding protein